MIGSRPPLFFASALAVTTACADTETVSVSIGIDPDSCEAASAGDVPLPCRGSVGVWLVSEEPAILDARCVSFGRERAAAGEVAGILADSGVSFEVVTEARVALELAVYPEEAGGCPRPGVEPDGGELDSWMRRGALYFGRSESRALAEAGEIAVTLACLQSPSGCEPPDPDPGDELAVTAEIMDMESTAPAAPDDVAQVELASLEGDDEAIELEPLVSLQGENPFRGTLEAAPPDTPCLATLVTGSRGLDFLSCEVRRITGDVVDTAGYRARFDLLVDLFGAEEVGELLEHGFVVGRIATDDDHERVSVAALDPGYDVWQEGAWFLAHRGGDTPHCCARFSIEGPELSVKTQPVPVLPGLISTVVVRD